MPRNPAYNADEVIEQTMLVFWQKGFSATSMSEVYLATGLKPGSVYGAFKSKDELFRLAFEKYIAHFRRCLSTDAEGVAAINSFLSLQASLSSEDPQRKGCLIVNTVLERGVHTEATRKIAEALLEEVRAFFLAQLVVAKNKKEVSDKVNSEIAADALLGATISIMALGRAGAAASTIWNIARSAAASLSAPNGNPQ